MYSNNIDSGVKGGGKNEIRGIRDSNWKHIFVPNILSRIVGDGDTKSFQHVVDSARYKNTNIQKLECVGHVQTKMGTRLRNLRTEKKGLKMADGKGITGKARLTDKVMNLMQNYYGMAIRQNVDNVYAMKKSIIAILYHCSQNDNEDDWHKFCPRSADSWCSYQSGKHTAKNAYEVNVNLPVAIKIC